MTRTTSLILSLLISSPVPATAANVALPELGDASAATISPAQERKLGEDFMRKARRALVFLDDPEAKGYLQRLGQRLVVRSDQPQQEFEFFAISDGSVNAFAVPGGFIGVNTGLLLAAQSEAELASVLAHEIAHVTQRHIPRMIDESQRASLPAMAALLAAVILAGKGQPGGEAAIAATSAAMAQKGINFTRASEEEADRIGVALLAGAGFDPRAMPAFFERMQNLNRHNETNLPEFLRTHPVTTSRIADSRARAERHTYRQTPDSSEFHHVRAKVRAAAAGDPREIARGFKENLDQGRYRDADAERYGYAWALLRTRAFDSARREIQGLLGRHPNNPSYHIVKAEIDMAAAKYPAALATYSAAHKRFATYPPLERYYARALLKTGQPRPAMELLQAAIKTQPADPILYQLLAQAAGAAGKRVEAHQALAEHYYLSGNPPAAIEQLQIAGRYAGDNFYLQSGLDARVQAIKEEVALTQTK